MMNVEVEFIQINEAIGQLQDALTDSSFLGSVLKNQGFLDLDLYFKNYDDNLIVVDKFIKSEIYSSIAEVYPPKNLINSNPVFSIGKISAFSAVNFILQSQTLKELNYYWRADDFYKKLGANKKTVKTVVFYTNQITSDKQKDLADKKLQSELENIKTGFVEQKRQLQAKSSEVNNLKAQLEQANAHIKEIESQSSSDNLSKIFDKEGEFFAPDLAHAINLWLDTYGNGKKKDDSHTNLANQWIKLNTNYDKNGGGYRQVENRIREITTPLKDFGAKRLKEK